MKLFRKIETSNIGPGTLTFNRKKPILAKGGFYHGIMMWDFKTGVLVQELDNRSDYLGAINFSPDGNFLVSATDDGAIKLWRCVNSIWRLENQFQGESGRILSVALHSDNDALSRMNATTNKVEVWRLRADTTPKVYVFGYVAFHQNQPLVAIRKSERLIVVNYITDEIIFDAYVGDHLSQIAFGKNGNSIATINDSGELELLDLQTKSRQIFSRPGDYAVKVIIPTNRAIACVLYESGAIAIWDINDGILKETTYTKLYQADGMAISHQGNFLAVGSGAIDGGSIELWQLDF